MKRKFLEDLLKDLEIEEETKKKIINTIMDENGNDINAEKSKNEIIKNDLKVKEALIEDLNNKIKENNNIDIEAIKQEQFNLGKQEGSKELINFKKTNALKSALSQFKAKDVEILQKMLDNDKIEYEEKDGEYTVKGVDEQVKSIKESHAYLFEEENQNDKINLGGEHNGNVESNPTTLVGALREKYNK